MCAIIKRMGAVPAIQLGHTGRRGSEKKPWDGKTQLPADDPNGWQIRGPSPVPFGGRYTLPVQELSAAEIHDLHHAYADAARRVPLPVDVPLSGRVPDAGFVDLPLYGRIEPLKDIPAVGRYTDLLKVTVTW